VFLGKSEEFGVSGSDECSAHGYLSQRKLVST
jgi:hypothetical protein